ncbi:MAG TPA: DUF1638 domain-containing protein [Myxococcota bacterium]
MERSILIIACGALAREILELQRLNGWRHVTLDCLPAHLHNTPEKIPDALRAKLDAEKDRFDEIFVGYGDCGTGGRLDALLDEYGVERLPGAHCYEFFAGSERFRELAEDELGTFFLTDFLTRHFDSLVYRGLGLDRNPQLRDSYFGNYRRLLYLAQTKSPELEAKARECAERLGLEYRYHYTGLGELEAALRLT